MKKMYHLRDVRVIRNVMRSGMLLNGSFITVRAYPNRLHHSRYVFVVSRLVHKRAVKRNRVRRRLREWTRVHGKHDTIPFDIAVVAKPGAAEAVRGALYADISSAFFRLYKKITSQT